jgi:hypothetical protein
MSKDPEKNPSLDAETLMARLDKQLDEMETAEILRDMTPEMLAKKGFIGGNPVEIRRSTNRQVTEQEHLLFEPGIEFERPADGTSIDSIDIASLSHIPNVQKGQLIASRGAQERTSFEPGGNVVKDIADGVVRFHATLRGKPVILKNALHVVPSDADCRVHIRLDESRMHAYLDCAPAQGDGKPLSVELVRAEMKRMGITHGIDEDGLAGAVDGANQTRLEVADIPVAAGTPPVAAKPGAVEYAFETKPEEYDFRILPDGRIDYRNAKAILTAVENQLLASIRPAIPGTPGTTIMGESIPAENCAAAALLPGNGVRISPDGKEFYAAIAGCIILNGSMLDVVNIYVVNGDVDFSTGNISFNGTVVISGTVLDGFEVKADGDIIVARIVESARLEAGRDVIVKGGVLGRGKGLISAGRDIRIGHAQNARLEAQGAIYIGNYAINSYIATTRNLVMLEKRGAIIGGEVFALRGVDARTIGSESGAKTHIEAGTDYLVMRTIGEMESVIVFCEQNVRKIEDALKAVAGKLGPGGAMQPAMQHPLLKAIEKKRELLQRMAMMQAKRSDLQKASLESGPCYIKVRDTCYPDVSIKIRELKTVLTVPRQHVRFYDDTKAGEIAIGAY